MAPYEQEDSINRIWIIVVGLVAVAAFVLGVLLMPRLFRPTPDRPISEAAGPAEAVPMVTAEPHAAGGFTISGRGWAGDADVTLYLVPGQGRPDYWLGRLLTAQDGSFRRDLAWLPEYPSGEGVELVARSGSLEARVPFELTPRSLDPVVGGGTATATATASGTVEPTATPTPTATATVTPSPTATSTAVPTPTATSTPAPPPTPAVILGWRGEYFANPSLAGEPALVRDDPAVTFDWGNGSPAQWLPADGFGVRWTRDLNLDAGSYRFLVAADDGIRLWIDDSLVLDRWYPGSETNTVEITLGGGLHRVRLEYFEETGDARVRFEWGSIMIAPTTQPTGTPVPPATVAPIPTPAPIPPTPATITAWRGEYFANPGLEGAPFLVRDDAAIGFDWGNGAPAAGMPADYFSVRWTRDLTLEAATWRFTARFDDGLRLWVDDQLLIDTWQMGSETVVATVPLEAGVHRVRVEYLEAVGEAHAFVEWGTVIS